MSSREDAWHERVEAVAPAIQRKRFHLSREPFAKERLRALKEEFARFQERHPEALSFHLYGSLSKGYAVPESDVDGILFFSLDNAREKPHDFESAPQEFEEAVGRRLGIKGQNSGCHFKMHVLGHAGLHVDLVTIHRAFEKIKERHPFDFENLDAHWNIFGLSQLTSPIFDKLVDIFRGVAIGRGIYPYRRQILEELKTGGAVGEKVWNAIICSLRVEERAFEKGRLSDHDVFEGKYENLYPQTIDDAIKYFVERKPFRKAENK